MKTDGETALQSVGGSLVVSSYRDLIGDDALSTKPVMHYQGKAYLCC